ncbi:transposase [Mycobacterium lacus]
MTCFNTAAQLASWAGVCSGHHESAGKSRQVRPARVTPTSKARSGSPRWLPCGQMVVLPKPLQATRGPPRANTRPRSHRAFPPDRDLAHPHQRRTLPNRTSGLTQIQNTPAPVTVAVRSPAPTHYRIFASGTSLLISRAVGPVLLLRAARGLPVTFVPAPHIEAPARAYLL